MSGTVSFFKPSLSTHRIANHQKASIAGVSYRDNFDFEERYKKQHVCDPLYWHPLHLPDECLRKYEKVIRSQVVATNPAKVMKSKEKETFMKIIEQAEKTQQQQFVEKTSSAEFDVEFQDVELEIPPYRPYRYRLQYQDDQDEELDDDYEETEAVDFLLSQQSKMPYEVMLEMVQRDASKLPAMPFVGLLPYLGAATVYQQPISENTEDVIKKIAHVYAHAAQDTYKQSIYDPVYSTSTNNTVPVRNETKTGKHKSSKKHRRPKMQQPYDESAEHDTHDGWNRPYEPTHNVNIQPVPTTPKNDKKNKVINKKITIGNLVAYYQETASKS